MAADAFLVDLQIQNSALHAQLEQIIRHSEHFALRNDSSARGTSLLILELSANVDAGFKLAENALNSREAREVFLISDNPDQDILLKAIRAGVRELFGPAPSDIEIRAALDRFVERHANKADGDSSSEKRIVAVFGSKGGVGTTTISVNLAVSLAQQDQSKSVALLDLNLFGDISLFLEIEPTFTWREIIQNISRLDVTFLKSILSVDPSGVFILPSPGYLDNQNMATPDIIEDLLVVMLQMFDIIVVDMGQFLDENSLKVISMANLLFLVTVQSLPCIAKATKILESFEKIDFPSRENIRLVINRHLKNAAIAEEEMAKSLDRDVFWKIPNDYLTTISAINKGMPLARYAPKQPITKSFHDLAAKLIAKPENAGNKKRKWWFFGSDR